MSIDIRSTVEPVNMASFSGKNVIGTSISDEEKKTRADTSAKTQSSVPTSAEYVPEKRKVTTTNPETSSTYMGYDTYNSENSFHVNQYTVLDQDRLDNVNTANSFLEDLEKSNIDFGRFTDPNDINSKPLSQRTSVGDYTTVTTTMDGKYNVTLNGIKNPFGDGYAVDPIDLGEWSINPQQVYDVAKPLYTYAANFDKLDTKNQIIQGILAFSGAASATNPEIASMLDTTKVQSFASLADVAVNWSDRSTTQNALAGLNTANTVINQFGLQDYLGGKDLMNSANNGLAMINFGYNMYNLVDNWDDMDTGQKVMSTVGTTISGVQAIKGAKVLADSFTSMANTINGANTVANTANAVNTTANTANAVNTTANTANAVNTTANTANTGSSIGSTVSAGEGVGNGITAGASAGGWGSSAGQAAGIIAILTEINNAYSGLKDKKGKNAAYNEAMKDQYGESFTNYKEKDSESNAWERVILGPSVFDYLYSSKYYMGHSSAANRRKMTLKLGKAGATIGTCICPGWGTLIGAAVGGASGLLMTSFNTGHSAEQRKRQVYRDMFVQNGVFIKNQNEHILYQLANGEYYNVGIDGSDGRATYLNGDRKTFYDRSKLTEQSSYKVQDRTELLPYEIDYTNNLDYTGSLLSMGLYLLGNGSDSGKTGSGENRQMLGYLTNAVTSNSKSREWTEDNFNSIVANIKAGYSRNNITTKSDLMNNLGLSYMQGNISTTDYNQAKMGANMVFDKDGYNQATQLMTDMGRS